jgi:hypothetical protein
MMNIRNPVKLLAIFLSALISFSTFASPQDTDWFVFDDGSDDLVEDGGPYPNYKPHGRTNIPMKEKLLNFGAVYGAQWAFYVYSQYDTIEKHGSVRNWYENALSPRFDHDSFEYNIFKHSFTGNYYYLFYRSRNYTEKNAFFWAFMSSLAFEFTIETITEVPSYQDIYQTPVFGTVVGIGFEKLSIYFHNWETWYGAALGFLVNPMSLIPQFAREDVIATPIVDNKTIGGAVTYRF